MTHKPAWQTEPGEPTIYQIRLKGELGQQWTAWFAGLTIMLAENGDTLLTGPIVDQAALHGVLRKVRDLGMTLLSVVSIDEEPEGVSGMPCCNKPGGKGK